MSETLEDFVQNLQDQIYEETRGAYGEKVFQRWLKPVHQGMIDNLDGFACLTGRCGDTMEVFLKFEDERVKEASYRTNGCGSSNAAGSYAAEMALGRNPDELMEITGKAILEKMDGLPEAEEHCAFLAAETLQAALNDYMIKQPRKEKGGEREPESVT
ncbi:MAG: iron-sulfur cluster assembly scaffold protein [Pseudomonadota bacterium]